MNLILLMMTNCSTRQTKLAFTHYPDFKLGFTSQNFIECLPVTIENEMMLLDYAADKGFSFFELRDPDAVLRFDECNQIASYGIKKGIEIAYANQRGLLDPDFMDVFIRGLKNATAFTGPRTFRTTLSGLDFVQNKSKIGLSMDELRKAVKIANHAEQLAEEQGLQLVIENGAEMFTESNDTIFGFETFFKQVSSKVAWQLDTANPFTNKDNYTNPDSLKQYLENHAGKIKYIHLKAAMNFQAQKSLCPNDLDFGEIFRILAANKVGNISIELLVDNDLNTVYSNMDKSVTFLRESGFIV